MALALGLDCSLLFGTFLLPMLSPPPCELRLLFDMVELDVLCLGYFSYSRLSSLMEVVVMIVVVMIVFPIVDENSGRACRVSVE